MKKLMTLILLIAVIVAGCKSESSSGNGENKVSFIESASAKVKTLWMNDDGDFRGISLGDSADMVKKTEKCKLESDYVGMLGYKLEFTPEDWVDLQFNFDAGDNTITDIGIMYEQKTKNQLAVDLTDYLTKRYGAPVKTEDTQVWNYKSKGMDKVVTMVTSLNAGWERMELYIEEKFNQ